MIFKTFVIVVSTSVFGGILGRPSTQDQPVTPGINNSSQVKAIKDERQQLDGNGNFKYNIELSDGSIFTQEGGTEAPSAGENETFIFIRGSYSYTAPDGTPVNVKYIANKDGFQATGNVIPTIPSPIISSSTTAATQNAFPQASSSLEPSSAPPVPVTPIAPAFSSGQINSLASNSSPVLNQAAQIVPPSFAVAASSPQIS